jgi:hypothetical protein
MRRREFITLIGGAAVAWPLVARAQQGEQMRRIGVLNGQAANDPDAQASIAAFLQGLQQLGWTDGRNRSIIAGAQAIPPHPQIRGGTGRARTRPHGAIVIRLNGFLGPVESKGFDRRRVGRARPRGSHYRTINTKHDYLIAVRRCRFVRVAQ